MEACAATKPLRRRKPNILPTPAYCRKYENVEHEEKKTAKLEVSDPAEILLLAESLFNNNTLELEKKINHYIKLQTDAYTVFIVTLVTLSEEAVVQVIGQNVLEREYRTTLNSNVFSDVIHEQEPSVNDLEDFDPNLVKILDELIVRKEDNYSEVITVPVFSKLKRGNYPALPLLVCVVNSSRTQELVTKIVNEVYRFCLPVMINTSKLEEEARIKRQCQALLRVARKLFSHLGDLSDLLKEIMTEARRLTNSERCSLFLMDPNHIHLVATVFDGIVRDNTVNTEVKIAKDQGIAGHVAATGKLLNIRDAYKHPLFYKGMDEATGFRTRNILCFPIRDECGIIGVAQLCNKIGGNFDFFDEEVALAFSIYCGLSIMHSLVYKKLSEAQNRSKLSNELMLYHMKINAHDIKKILLCTHRHSYLDYDTFRFPPKRVRVPETPCQILKMFDVFNFFETFRIKRETLVKFILYVKKGYRDTPYHNWMHAFSVAHFAYVAIKQLELLDRGYLTPLEALALIVSCMCHDIDHRGTTNSFQEKSESVLANLYSSEGSVMEHHHLSQTLCILNTEDCNFLDSLSNEDYVRFLALIKDMILATDLANHFLLAAKQQVMIEEGYDANNLDHKYVFICLLMTCSDLSDQIKEWDVIKEVASQIYNEFFQQGDLEKSMGKTPIAMMDRNEASIPQQQIEFITHICLPVYTLFSQLFPETEDIVERMKLNVLCWEASKPVFERMLKEGGYTSLEILSSPEIDKEVQKVLQPPPEEAPEEDDISDETVQEETSTIGDTVSQVSEVPKNETAS